MSESDLRSLTSEYNRLMNWLQYSSGSSMLDYIEQTEELFKSHDGMFNTNDATKKQKTDLEGALEKCKAKWEDEKAEIEAEEKEREEMEKRALEWTDKPRTVSVKNEDKITYHLTLEFEGMSREDKLAPNRTLFFADPGETVIIVGGDVDEVVEVPEGCKGIVIKGQHVKVL
eukprot:TRINITY_DN10761_c0_g1_i1.p1 TRINITY_DN10761_c0_g1~~TRINITY_DN10761_c0_g1_i1.p1  ORF type:complete len:172 (-),score=53.95 TRINITY_DN10761_c0_g1_i1:92-607(-)